MRWQVLRLGPGSVGLALLLSQAALIWQPQPTVAQVSTPRGVLGWVHLAIAEPPPRPQSTSSPVPRPASKYALDEDALGGVIENVGAFTGLSASGSADDADHLRSFHASSAEAGTTTVESSVSILNTDDAAEDKYNDLQRVKSRELNVQFEGVSGWKTGGGGVSTFQTPNASGERVTGALLRFRNAIALVEIRGSIQRVSTEDAKQLMKKILKSLRDATGAPD